MPPALAPGRGMRERREGGTTTDRSEAGWTEALPPSPTAAVVFTVSVEATPSNEAVMANFANFTMGHYGASFPASCFYDSECLKNLTNLDMSRSWRWQKCTELAFLQSGFPGSLRHEKLSIDDLMTQCKHVFGEEVITADCAYFFLWGLLFWV